MITIYGMYERIVPAFVRRRIRAVISSPESLAQVLWYGGISATVLVTELLLLHTFVAQKMPLPVAISVAYGISIALHFSALKYLGFKKYDGSLRQQAGTYLSVVFVYWLAIFTLVQLCVNLLHVAPVVARVLIIPFLFPLSFLGHRHLTFGSPAAALARVRSRIERWSRKAPSA
jgi:putative flippase GtrA